MAVLLMLASLFGCAPAADQIQETNKETWTVNTELLEIIKAAADCNDSRAKAILEVFQEIKMDMPVSASRMNQTEHSILVETQDGKKYEVGIDRKCYVYSVKDIENGEYLYIVYE